MQSIGTRGDIEPFLAQAEILSRHGHEIGCCFPEQFRKLVQGLGYEFYGLDRRFLEMLESQTGQSVMGGSENSWKRFQNFFKLASRGLKLQDNLIAQQLYSLQNFKPEKVIFHPKCVFPILWEIAYPGTTIMICPLPCALHEVRELSTMTFSGNANYGTFLNLLSHRLVNTIRAGVFNRITRKYRKHLPPFRVNAKIIKRTMLHQIPALYTISPSLFPRPTCWPSHLHVTGYFERSQRSNWQPPAELLQFIERHHKILMVTFGSMRNPDPLNKTMSVIEAVTQLNIPTIINTSWGGLEKPEEHPPSICFVSNVPYSWIFPKMHAVVHHGGAGTTHAACKHACPSLIIPHIVDQYFWNQRIAYLKLGPKGLPIKKLNKDRLLPLLQDLWDNDQYKGCAVTISQCMATETKPQAIRSLLQSYS